MYFRKRAIFLLELEMENFNFSIIYSSSIALTKSLITLLIRIDLSCSFACVGRLPDAGYDACDLSACVDDSSDKYVTSLHQSIFI